MGRVWFEREILPAYANHIDSSIVILRPPSDPSTTAQGIVASISDYDQKVISQAPNLLVISRTGIGYDKVDVQAATNAGVAVCNVPNGPTVSTAECAITLMMSVAKNIKAIEKTLHYELAYGSKRHFYQDYTGIELAGKQLGLVGLGRIGSHVARIASAIGMTVIAYDPFVKSAPTEVQISDSLETLLSTSDIVSLHLPLTADNQKFMNTERFAMMKQGSIFINTARGGHVDEQALLEVLDSGHLFGAGLDVTDPEPPLADNPLLARDNVVVTPHIASGTSASKFRIYDMAVRQVLMVLNGERPPHLVNPEAWDYVLDRWKKQEKL